MDNLLGRTRAPHAHQLRSGVSRGTGERSDSHHYREIQQIANVLKIPHIERLTETGDKSTTSRQLEIDIYPLTLPCFLKERGHKAGSADVSVAKNS